MDIEEYYELIEDRTDELYKADIIEGRVFDAE